VSVRRPGDRGGRAGARDPPRGWRLTGLGCGLVLGLTLLASATVGTSIAASPARPSAARLEGFFLLSGRVTAATNVRGERVGEQVRRIWAFDPLCPAGSCEHVRLTRIRPGGRDQVLLHRVAAAYYIGRGHFYAPLSCAKRIYPEGDGPVQDHRPYHRREVVRDHCRSHSRARRLHEPVTTEPHTLRDRPGPRLGGVPRPPVVAPPLFGAHVLYSVGRDERLVAVSAVASIEERHPGAVGTGGGSGASGRWGFRAVWVCRCARGAVRERTQIRPPPSNRRGGRVRARPAQLGAFRSRDISVRRPPRSVPRTWRIACGQRPTPRSRTPSLLNTMTLAANVHR